VGTTVSLTATPGPGSLFVSWEGSCTGTGTCILNLARSSNVTANFTSTIPRLAGISTRGLVETGDNRLIAGFQIGGQNPKKVVVTARGPSLASQGITGALPDPSLELRRIQGLSSVLVASNDDWPTGSAALEIEALGKSPPHPREASVLATLQPGIYTATVSGVGGGFVTGVGIVEVWEIDEPNHQLLAISTRGLVQTGDNVMIGGFIIQGNQPQTVVVRARGPSMGLFNALQDPTLTLVPTAGESLTNDDWGSAPTAQQLLASGLAPGNAKESASMATLAPGAYTVIVSGVGGTTGLAIVEVIVVD